MRKLVLTMAMAASALPGMAMAQNGELRRDRQDVRHEQRELRDARMNGDRRDVRDERHDVRDARQELREDRRDFRRDEWRDYRNTNRALFGRGNWNASFRYNAFRPGVRIGVAYYGPRYVIADPWRYHLARPAYYQRWVRHYNDLLLVDVRRGVVVDVIRNFYW
ncbi:MAG: RcnB family protein [Sphingomonadaceae bacterium]|nr:RcnB family protein [Sphingomonadaceae bacterium]